MAVIAAQEGQDSNETVGPDGETFMEKYTRGVSAVETILTLDRYVFKFNNIILQNVNGDIKYVLSTDIFSYI